MARLTHFLIASEWRAAAIASILLFLPIMSWLGPTVVALFALRRGLGKALVIATGPFLVSLGIALVFGDSAMAIVLLITMVLATTLNRTLNWLAVLQVGFVMSLVLVLLVGALYEETLKELVVVIKTVIMASAELSTLGVDESKIDAWMASLSVGSLSFVYMASAFCAVTFARAMQAQAFNPGGFKVEFEEILLPPVFAGLLLVVALLGFVTDPWMLRFTPIASLPLMFAGIALVHGLTNKRKSKALLLFFYAALLFFTPYLLALVALVAVIDAFVDFRARALDEPPIDEDD